MASTVRPALASLARRSWVYLKRGVEIDTRTLAVFRVWVGLLIIADLLLRSRNFSFYYTESGVVPQSLAKAMTHDGAFSFYHFTTSSDVIAGLFVLQGLIALQLVVGYKTRIATILSFLFVISLDHHNPLVLSYADTLFRLLMFWAIFLPLGERWSIDAVHMDRRPRRAITSIASALILLQMVYMYFHNGLHKTQSELWTGGDATPLVMGLDEMTFLIGDYMRYFPELLQLGGLTWFYMLLFSWLLLLLRGRKRLFLVGLFMGGHASFALTVRIGAFAYVAFAGLLLFLQTQFWRDLNAMRASVGIPWTSYAAWKDRLERAARQVPALTVFPETQKQIKPALYTIGIAAVLVFLVFSFPYTGVVLGEDTGPTDEAESVANTLNIGQPDWTVFAPVPRTTDRYYVFTAETSLGDRFDIYNERPLTYERPGQELQKQHGTYRQRFYMNSIRRAGSVGTAPDLLAEHLCTTWEETHGVEITNINMYVVEEDVEMDTIDAPEDRDREYTRLSVHACGDHPTKHILPPDAYFEQKVSS